MKMNRSLGVNLLPWLVGLAALALQHVCVM
jgi:hypothetical protein